MLGRAGQLVFGRAGQLPSWMLCKGNRLNINVSWETTHPAELLSESLLLSAKLLDHIWFQQVARVGDKRVNISLHTSVELATIADRFDGLEIGVQLGEIDGGHGERNKKRVVCGRRPEPE